MSGAALSGAAAWFVITLLVPAAISGLAVWRYPIPSRAALLVEQRSAQEWSERERPALVAQFKAQLAGDTTAGESLGWLISTFAADARVRPSGLAITSARDARHDMMVSWSLLSPATAAESALLETTGTGEIRFRGYRAQLFAFLAAWRDRYTPMIRADRPLVARDFDERPRFRFVEPDAGPIIAYAQRTGGLLLGLALVLVVVVGRRTRWHGVA